MIYRARLPLPLTVLAICFLPACYRDQSVMQPQPLSPEQKEVVGTWSLLKPVERGSVFREFVFHGDGATFSTTCRSIFDKAIADGKGEGRWSVEKGIVNLHWVEHAKVGNHSEDIEYDLALKMETIN